MKRFKFGFTLAEIMIVLMIIGIISAVLLPNVSNIMSNEKKNLAKFKKGHNDLLQAVDILVKSDKYYVPGDFGLKPNGDLIDGSHTGDITYFCKSLADVFKTKSVNCSSAHTYSNGFIAVQTQADPNQALYADQRCKEAENAGMGAEILTPDGIAYYNNNPKVTFGLDAKSLNNIACKDSSGNIKTDSGHTWCSGNLNAGEGRRAFNPDGRNVWLVDNAGFDRTHKLICMDIDGIKSGEDPFGYGIRVDGRVFPGKKAQEWLEKELGKKQ